MSLNAGQVSVGLTLDDTDYSRRLSGAAGALDDFSARALRVSALTSDLLGGAAAAIARFGQEALRVGGVFEASMTRVAAITGAEAAELASLTARARELGATLPIMARDAADAMGVLATRGYDAAKILGTVGDIVNLSIAQGYDLASTADLVSSTLNNFQLAETETARVADVFSRACNRSALSMEKLQYAFLYAGPSAAAVGASIEDTVAAMGALADAGYRGENIGIALRSIFNKLASSANILGVETKDAGGNMRTLADIMAEIGQKGFGLDKFTEAFDLRSSNAALTLSKSAAKMKNLRGEFDSVTGATGAQVERQLQTWVNVVKGFESRVEALYLNVFDQIQKTSKQTVVSLTDMTAALSEWVEKTDVAGRSFQAFLEGLGFELPSGAGFKEMLESIDVHVIVDAFEDAGRVVREIGEALVGLASAVPWEFLLANLDTIARVGFWSMVMSHGASIASTLTRWSAGLAGLVQGMVLATAASTAAAAATGGAAAASEAKAAADGNAAAILALKAAAEQADAAALAAKTKAAAASAAAEQAAVPLISRSTALIANRAGATQAETLAIELNTKARLANEAAAKASAAASAANLRLLEATHGTLKGGAGALGEVGKHAKTAADKMRELGGATIRLGPMFAALGGSVKGFLLALGTPLGLALSLLTATGLAIGRMYKDVSGKSAKILADARKIEQKSIDRVRELEKALEGAGKGERSGDWSVFNQEIIDALERETAAAQEAQKALGELEEARKRVLEAGVNLDNASDPLQMKVAAANMALALKGAREMLGTLEESSEEWKKLDELIRQHEEALSQIPKKIADYKAPEIDFAQANESVEKFSGELRKELRQAVVQGVSPKEAAEQFKEKVLKKIGDLSKDMVKNAIETGINEEKANALAAAWESAAAKKLGVDEKSLELQKFNTKIAESREQLAKFAEYLKKTGNASEHARNTLSEMTDSLAELQISKLDATQRQALIDELEKLGKTAGGKYAAALAERLKGGTKEAVKEAASRVPITEDELGGELSRRLRIREQSKRPLRVDKNTVAEELELHGLKIKLTREEVQAYKDGNVEMMEAARARVDKEIAWWEKLSESGRKIDEEAKKREEEAARRRSGNPPDAQDPEKTLGALEQALSAIGALAKTEGTEAARAFSSGLTEYMTANPLSAAVIQLPQLSMTQMTQDLKSQMNQVTSALQEGFSRLSLPAPNTDGFFTEFVRQINDSVGTVELALSSAFSGIDLTPAGAKIGKTLSEGIIEGIVNGSDRGLPRLGEKIYEMVSERLSKSLILSR